MKTVRLIPVVAVAAALALTACGKKEEPAAPAADATGATAPATTTASADIPAECNAYTAKVEACVNKLSQNNPAAAEQFRSQLEQTRASWSQVTDKAALASACKQAESAFTGVSGAMGC